MQNKKVKFWFEDSPEKENFVNDDVDEEFSEDDDDDSSDDEDFESFDSMFGNIADLMMGGGIVPVKIVEKDNKLLLKVKLAGFSKEDVKLKVAPMSITISAQKKEKNSKEGRGIFKRQEFINNISRVIALPEEVETKNVKAKMQNGILNIIMIKKNL